MNKRLKLVDWMEINSEKHDSLTSKMIQYVSIAEQIDADVIGEWDINDLMKKYKSTKWIEEPINNSDATDSISFDDSTLNLIEFNSITFGQFIDLEFLISQGFVDNINKIVTTLYLKSEKEKFKKAIVENYGDVDIDERAKFLMYEISINDVLGSANSYLKWRDNIFNSYTFWDDSLDDINPEDLSGEELEIFEEETQRLERAKDTMWEDMLGLLSDGDITKYDDILGTNIYLVFNRIAKVIEDAKKSNKK